MDETKQLLKALAVQGFRAERGGSGHWKVYNWSGRLVTTLSATPSDWRGMKNAVARLRREGFVWPVK
jgi:hypothetical protein